MNMKVYEKTRYQNIYRHRKNKNYMIMISKPVKTSISKIDGKRILSIEEALSIRDNPKIKQQKGIETVHKEDFDTLWEKYIDYAINIKKLAYGTIKRKNNIYKPYLKGKIKVKVTKTNKLYWAKFIHKLKCSDKEKNQVLKELGIFFNWCVNDGYLLYNPVKGIQKYKVVKSKMLFWTPEEFLQFIQYLKNIINNNSIKPGDKYIAWMIYIFSLIIFNTGDRTGETRVLYFDCFNETNYTLSIFHSINYDTKSNDFLGSTKTYHSQRVIDITPKLMKEINNYKSFLINEMKLKITGNTFLFLNHKTNKPYTDTNLRSHFTKYCEKANVSVIRMYDLRHTYVATMMAEGKELYHISERIGHNNFRTTVDKYGHLSNQVRKEIAEVTDKYY